LPANFTTSLEYLKENEIKFSDRRINHDECKSIDQSIVDSITTNFRYTKHKILLDWLSLLGFESLNSSLEIEGLENIIEKCIITKETCNVFGGGVKILEEKISKNILRFINNRLKEEFGVSIKKKGTNRNCNKYILDNPYIEDCIFELEDNNTNTPVLGKSLDKKIDNEHYQKYLDSNMDAPYDSDDDYNDDEEEEE
jgi:hypothetical protein